MKIIRAEYKNFRLMSPIQPSVPIWFENHLAAVSDEMADWLLGMPGNQFVLERNIVPAEMSSVKLVRDAGMGDVLLTTALVRSLAKSGVKVTVATENRYKCVFENNPYVVAVLGMDDAQDQGVYDCTVNLCGYVESTENARRFHNRAWAFGNTFGLDLKGDDLHLDLFLTEEEKQLGKRLAGISNSNGSEKAVGVVWRSSTSNRNHSPQRVRETIAELAARGYTVCVIDYERQDLAELAGKPGILNLTGQLSIRHTFCVLSACDVIVTPDSGPFHIASALGKPVVSYFGCFPLSERATHLKVIDLAQPSRCALFPCRKYSCYNRVEHGQGASVSACIDVEAVKVADAVDAARADYPL